MSEDSKISRLENFYVILIIFFLIYEIFYVINNGYLSVPFFYDKSDTFMDFFNVYSWAYDDGRYAVWQSIYSPLSFLLTKLFPFDIEESIGLNPGLLRKQNYVMYLLIMTIITIIFMMVDYAGHKSKKRLLITYLSFPFLFSIERGNLIVFAYFFWMLSLRFEKKSNFLSNLWLVICVSLKTYFIVFLILKMIRVKVKEIFYFIFLYLIVSYLSALALGANDWYLMFSNLFSFSGLSSYFEWGYFGYSFQNLFLLLNLEYLEFFNYLILMILFFLYVFSIIFYLFTKKNIDNVIYILTIISILIFVKNAGGYVAILLLPFYSFFRENLFRFSLFLLLIAPFSVNIPNMGFQLEQVAFFTDEIVTVEKSIHVMMIIRPLVILILFFEIYYSIFKIEKTETKNESY